MPSIKVNIFNELTKIRNGVVYSSVTAIVDEIIQNSQRAKATEIHIVADEDTIIIADNGIGCKNLAQVFEKSSSGWGLDEAFGEGFFSTFAIADRITVESLNKKASVDVLNIMETGDLSYSITDGDRQLKGFAVTLQGTLIKENLDSLYTHLAKIASYLPAQVTLNGGTIAKKEITELPWAVFSYPVNNKLYQGQLAPDKQNNDIEVFYEYRDVCEVYVGSVTGKLHLKQGAVTLKAPDRKAIVRDNKYSDFRSQLMEDTTKMYKKIIKDQPELIDVYAEQIGQFLTVADYINQLELEGIQDVTKYIGEVSMVTAQLQQVFAAALAQDTAVRDQQDREDSTELFEVSNKKKTRRKKITTLKNDKKTIWVGASEVDGYKEAIAELEYYGFKVVIAKHILYEEAFKSMGLMHIGDVKQNIIKQHSIKNVTVKTSKEKRALWLFEKIETKYNIPGTFLIADLGLNIVTKIGDKVISKESKVVAGVTQGEHIYMNRKSLQLAKMDNSSAYYNWDRVNIEDLRFLLRNLDTLAHELAHRIESTEDNTLGHFQAQTRIASELAECFVK